MSKKTKKIEDKPLTSEIVEKARAWDYWCEHAHWDRENGLVVIHTKRTGQRWVRDDDI